MIKSKSLKKENDYTPTDLQLKNIKIRNGCFKVSGDGVFFTIQGEGVSMGRSSIFVRLHFCNLQCEWCDTKYTWDKSRKEYWLEPYDLTLGELHDIVTKFNCRRVVFTGGEPLLQRQMIEKYIRMFPKYNYEIETNCTIMPSEYLLNNLWFNCSPKLDNSKNDNKLRMKPKIIARLNKISNSVFKFVVKRKEDIDDILNNYVQCNHISKDKIIIMPEGASLVKNIKVMRAVVDYCRDMDLRVLPRLHTIIWGEKRAI